MSTLTEANAGADQPFVTQKEINYFRYFIGVGPFLLFVLVPCIENLASIGIISSSHCFIFPLRCALLLLESASLATFFQNIKGRPFYFSISLVLQIHSEDRLEVEAKTHPLQHILHYKPIL